MEKLIWNIYKGLSVKDEFEFHICSLVNHGETFMISEFRSVPSEVLILNASNNNYKISDYMRIVKTMFILARYVAKNKIDIVHSHDFFSAFVTRVSVILCIILWWHKPQQNIVTLHNLFFWLRKPHRVINKTLSFFTDKIICVSKSVFENSYKNDKIKKEKYAVIYNSINENDFKPEPEMNTKYRALFGFGNNDFIIGNVGAFSFRKGQKYLVKAFAGTSLKYEKARLVIFGSPVEHEDEIYNEINKLIEENNLRDKVSIIAPRNDIKFIYNMFDVFVMSSVSEGLSLASLEAMLTERICIYSNIGPFEEIIDDEVNGFLFETRNPSDLESKLNKVITNYMNLDNVKKNARQSVIKNFNYDKMINSYYNLYKTN